MMRLISAALLAIALVMAGLAGAAEKNTGTVTGQFRISGDTPMADGMVYFYNLASGPPPSHDRYWRIPDFVEKLDHEGRFQVELPAGEYCVGAIKRTGTGQIGPPFEGDLIALSIDEKKQPRKYVVAQGEKRDFGVIAGAHPFSTPVFREGGTAIEGTVLDEAGKPVEGAIVFAFMTPTVVGKPLFVSDRSNRDGKFLLRVHQGGTFYLKVRDNYGGGPPRGGSMLDGNKDEPLHKVVVKDREIHRGAKLMVRKFPGRGPNRE